MEEQPHNERAQSLVEIALVLPILVILFLGIAEVGFFLFSQVQVANAAREGARRGSLCRLNDNCDGGDGNYGSSPDLSAVVREVVQAEAQSLKMNGSNSKVDVQPNLTVVPAVGTPITVTVTYTHSPPFISNFVPMFPAEIPVQHTVVMHFDK